MNIWKQSYFLPLTIAEDKTFNQLKSSSSSCLNEMINFIFNYQDQYTLNMQNYLEVYIEIHNT